MTRMMRGHTYSCGCCHSYGRGQQRSRRDDDREIEREIRDELVPPPSASAARGLR